jgi:hypothetical protein
MASVLGVFTLGSITSEVIPTPISDAEIVAPPWTTLVGVTFNIAETRTL